MSVVATVCLWVFIAAWCVGLGGFIYGSRFFVAIWAVGFRKLPKHEGYGRKMAIGSGVFLAAIAVGFAAGGIAHLAGGWK